MIKAIVYIVLLLILAIPPFVYAEDIAKSVVAVGIDAGFSDVERQLIEKYFGKNVTVTDSGDKQTETRQPKAGKGNKDLPPGLAKRDRLPPGLERQLQKNGTLPPGLAKRSLPSDLEQQLPPAPEGYERQIIENAAIVLVHKATGRIADVVKDIVIGD
jgi:hypothetical protein